MNKALIIIDTINAIINPDEKKYTLASCSDYVKEHPDVIENLNTLIEIFRKSHCPIIFVNLGFSPDYHDCPVELKALVSKQGAFKIGTKDTEIYNKIHAKKEDKIIIKTSPSPFVGTNLEKFLHKQGIDELVITGFATHNAVQKAVFEAKGKSFAVTVVADACGDRSSEHHVNALQTLRDYGVFVVKTSYYSTTTIKANTKYIDINPITPDKTLRFRHDFLRPDEAIEECIFPGDYDATTKHFGAFSADILLGVISMYSEVSPKLSYTNQYRLRGLVVLPELRGQGIGKGLMQKCIEYGKSIGASVLWGNARSIALDFHLKQNFRSYGEEFELERKGINGPIKVKAQFIYLPLE